MNRPRWRVPIRLKFMLTLLALMAGVVSVITFSTATLFQSDKKAYVNGLTSMVSLGMAEEVRTTLGGYKGRLGLYARLMLDEGIPRERREAVSRTMFDEFPELISIEVKDDTGRSAEIHNGAVLESSGVSAESLRAHRDGTPVPAGATDGGSAFIRNTTFTETLPCFTMRFVLPPEAGGKRASIAAVLSTDPLIRLVSRFSAYESFLLDSEGTYLAHPDAKRLLGASAARLQPIVANVHDAFSAAVTREFELGGTPMIGGFADSGVGKVVAVAQIPTSAANLASERLIDRLLLVALILLVAAIAIGLFLAFKITRPLQRLSAATREVAKGRLEVAVDVESHDEMGELAASFNHMTSELLVRERALRDAHAQLVQSEKMAAFGQLGAGIAHEVKNPLAGILSCAQLAADDLDELSPVRKDLKLIEKEARRCKTIIDNLLKFARQEKAERTPTDVNAVISDSVAILTHQMELNETRLETDLAPDLPEILGNANQLQQVLMNLMINAQQAMEGTKGKIRISSCRTGSGGVELRVTDTGPGIPEAIRTKLFEPFFTTKPPGKGTGLGLSVSFGIVKEHRGEIAVESEVGAGTTFVVTLPPSADTRTEEPSAYFVAGR